jgi:hypothetical protein
MHGPCITYGLGVPSCPFLSLRYAGCIAENPVRSVVLLETAGQHSKIQILVNLADVVVPAQSQQGLLRAVHPSPMPLPRKPVLHWRAIL